MLVPTGSPRLTSTRAEEDDQATPRWPPRFDEP